MAGSSRHAVHEVGRRHRPKKLQHQLEDRNVLYPRSEPRSIEARLLNDSSLTQRVHRALRAGRTKGGSDGHPLHHLGTESRWARVFPKPNGADEATSWRRHVLRPSRAEHPDLTVTIRVPSTSDDRSCPHAPSSELKTSRLEGVRRRRLCDSARPISSSGARIAEPPSSR